MYHFLLFSNFRSLVSIMFLLAISTPVLSQSDDEKRAAMNAAYRQYQELVAQGPQFRAQAVEPARTAYELALEVLGNNDATTAALAMNYGNTLTDGDEAARILNNALRINQNLYGRNAVELIDPLMALGDSATAHSEFTDARRHYIRAYNVAEDMDPRDPFLEAIIGIQLGTTAFSLNRGREAIEYFSSARDKLQVIDNDIARIRLGTAQFWIGRHEIREGNTADAIAPLQASLRIFDRFPEARQLSINSHIALVEAYEHQGLRDEATPHVLAIGEGNTQPALLYSPAFTGPLWNAGPIEMVFDVDPQGFVSNVRVSSADAHAALAEAASAAVTALRYAPGFENGSAKLTQDIPFTLQFSRPR
jgi:hypothetical protein